MKRDCLCLFLILLSNIALLGQTPHKKGEVHDSVPVNGAPKETFALYLPLSFSNQELSSIVFVFDPAGRGAAGIQPFIPASEKYGHILICSNNSRNAPYERNFTIANNLFNHVFSHFNIKEDEMYASGFSGGSRLASAIASLTNKFAGVIGCGAGFSGIKEHMPAAHDYAYVGLCGNRDMNYKEMVENKGFLNLINFNSTLITFDEEHQWPPQEQILRAFDWLNLQKLKKEKPIPIDKFRAQYVKDYELVTRFRAEERLLFEAEQLERMIKDYKGIWDIDSIETQYTRLLKSKPLKRKLAQLGKTLEQERKWVMAWDKRLREDFAQPQKVNWEWWKKELGKLDKLKDKDNTEAQNMVYRIRFDLFVRLYSRKNELIHAQSSAQSTFIDRFIDLLKSD